MGFISVIALKGDPGGLGLPGIIGPPGRGIPGNKVIEICTQNEQFL